MNISAALAGVSRLGVETSPFIYFVEENPNYLDRVRYVFQQAASGRFMIVTSTISLTEVLVLPMQTGNSQYENAYRAMLMNSENVSTVAVSPAIAEQAAFLRAKYRLRTPDALHIATAIVSECEAILTNDLGLRRVTEIAVLVLDDLSLEGL
ncbi:MAG: type II toxin-antitoxin system VapC family toxin [Chloroflexi bacterium]|nr:type II toxin-antitoxin system VapC family toxin [Chloroflexota bacterium]